MLKTIFVSVFLFFASILLVANAAWSHPLLHSNFVAQTSVNRFPSEVTPSSKSVTPQASESSQTSSKQTPKDSKAETAKARNQATATSSKSEKAQGESGGPYDMESIKAFNRALYGS